MGDLIATRPLSIALPTGNVEVLKGGKIPPVSAGKRASLLQAKWAEEVAATKAKESKPSKAGGKST